MGGDARVMDGWIDASVPIQTGMVHWPGNPSIRVERTSDISRGDPANVSKLSCGVHTGTHCDAPIHIQPGAPGIDGMPLDATVGPARVIEIHHPRVVTADELRQHAPGRGERILLRTRNSPWAWRQAGFVSDFVHLVTDAAELLVACGVRTVGVDYLSIGGYEEDDGEAVHRTLLGAGVWVIEGLDLSAVPPGPCDLVCLPLNIVGSDGAPARAIVRPHTREEEST